MNTQNGRRKFLGRLLEAGSVAVLAAAAPAEGAVAGKPGQSYNVRDFGAVGDGAKLETQALQQAIDQCAQTGGGTVYFPAGRYLTGTLVLKSQVSLYLEAGATLLGSTKLEDYQVIVPQVRSYTDNYTERALIYGENLRRISIGGRGTIDGQGNYGFDCCGIRTGMAAHTKLTKGNEDAGKGMFGQGNYGSDFCGVGTETAGLLTGVWTGLIE